MSPFREVDTHLTEQEWSELHYENLQKIASLQQQLEEKTQLLDCKDARDLRLRQVRADRDLYQCGVRELNKQLTVTQQRIEVLEAENKELKKSPNIVIEDYNEGSDVTGGQG